MIKQVMNWIKTHRYCLAGLYMLVFLSGFFLLELHEPSDVHIIHCAVDDLIPFNEWFVLPYFLWYAWVPVFMIYFMIKDREAYLRLCFVMFAGATFCLFVYLLAPNGLNLRQEITSQNFCAQIVRFLRSVDPPNNVCPSIHVSSGASDDLPRGKCAEQETDPYTFVDCHDSDLSFNHVHQTAFAGRCALWLDFEPDS